MGSRITRKDVAERAGVSSAVVSYVVNNGPRPVAKETRLKVLAAIEELGYMPSATARALRLGATSTYGVVVPNGSHSFNAAVVHAVDQELSRHDLSMLLSNSHESVEAELTVIHNMVARGVDGLIVLNAAISDEGWIEQNLTVPAVLLDRQREIDGFITVGPDFLEGGKLATEHLIGHGHKEILPIFGTFEHGEQNMRYTGYRQAVREAGLQEVEPIICDWTREGGYEAGEKYVQMDAPPKAVFCFSDAIAIGFLKAVLDAGLRVPEDVAIVSFDGTDDVGYVHPTITTVRQPIPEMVQYGVEMLLAKKREQHTKHKIFPVGMQVGHSCGC
ncbi:MAG: LacI family DNA-binding transcriptional regulator [Actinomycetaceae bacterium]|nr:LacI family DNA-binding transcriptional regulator [Actinomycetaceae bacterium]